MKTLLHDIAQSWYDTAPVPMGLRWLSKIFLMLIKLRRWAYRRGILKTYQAPVPVIVVGNLTVGGTGKTPAVIWLVNYLRQAGYHPGVISRGYGGQAKNWPQWVTAHSDPRLVGDEPVLVAKRCACPVVVGPHRPDDVRCLLAKSPVDVIVSDDGLQHYALARNIEVVVLDGDRRFGNQYCLPAGPLREPMSRLLTVQFLLNNGGVPQQQEIAMRLNMQQAINLRDPAKRRDMASFAGERVHAVAGIGHPQRFFNQLKSYKINIIEHEFTDHFDFTAAHFASLENAPVLMTEKDAVKCFNFAKSHMWFVPVNAEIAASVADQIIEQLTSLPGDINGQQIT